MNDLIKNHTLTQISMMGREMVGHRKNFYKMLALSARASQADKEGFSSYLRELE